MDSRDDLPGDEETDDLDDDSDLEETDIESDELRDGDVDADGASAIPRRNA
jgi:hypothetical protein